jgi:heme oxygenase (mycobilin-producing)
MFVALSKFEVSNDMERDVKDAFRNRPHSVENARGFKKLDVISPLENPKEIWLITYWLDRESFETWHKSHLYREAHSGIPKGLKLVPRSPQLSFFEHVSS